MAVSPSPALLLDLREATAANPLDRKLLVCPSVGEGRELLRAHAAHADSWIGWEVTTPRRLALDLVGPDLAAAGQAIADAFDEEAAIDEALDAAAADAPAGLRELAESPGFRQAVVSAVSGLRLAGVATGALAASSAGNPALRGLLERVLRGYEEHLRASGLVDTAHVLERAAGAVAEPASRRLVGTSIWLVPGLGRRGMAGRLIDALVAAGARTLRTDPVIGPAPDGLVWAETGTEAPFSRILADRPQAGPGHGGTAPDLAVFAASGPTDELREVVRRVMAAGLAWDQVEIVATDAVVYGGALHALAGRLGIPVSYAVGLPVERTRTGRAATAYLRWLQTGYPADTLRQLLEAGDLRAPVASPPPSPLLARRLRQLRVGWGLDRYGPALERALRAFDGPPRPRRNESEAEAAARAKRERAQLEALGSLLGPILAATPRLDEDGTVAPAEIARGLRAFLELVPASDAPSATARERLITVAGRIAARLTRPMRPASAIAVVRRHLEIRVPAPKQEGSSPWTSAAGHLHLADLDHGGLTGRRATFVVGLDAERFPGAGLQDPLLPDAQRRALAPDALPSSADRLAANRFRLAALLARVRGRVTLSYSAWDPTQAREVAPAAVLLQAYRVAAGRPTASFEDLRDGIAPVASAVPRATHADQADVWLGTLRSGGILLDGVDAVTEAFPSLRRGLELRAALEGDTATSAHGAVTPRPDRLDPRLDPGIVVSATGLQDLGTCARRYFYRYVLGVRPPDDPELDPDRWLDPMNRGRLLHSVYERTLREARDAGLAAGSDGFIEAGLRVLEAEAAAIRLEIPPPGAAVLAREMAELREDVRSFARMVAGEDDRWTTLELKFGLEGNAPATLALAGGPIQVRGAIDRVDREGDGLVVIDYKTGAHQRYESKSGVFDGGRRLQNAVYAAVAETLLAARVHRMEYHFPTRRGQNEVIGYAGPVLREGLGLIDRLLDMAAAGRFLPTDAAGDCRFCDYAAICRHRFDGWAGDTPLADWAKERLGSLPEYAELRDVRQWEDRPPGSAGS